MKKQTLILLILFAISGSVTAWYLMQGDTAGKSTVTGWERQFKVDNTDQIHKIFIADRKGNTTTLKRKNNTWLYEGKYEVRQNAMDNLMRAFGEMEMMFKPAETAVPTMIKDLATQGIKVELYDEAGENLKTFYVGGGTPDETGTYMIMEGSEQPYVVGMPTWQGNLRARFMLTGDDWRDKSIFKHTVDDIQSVAVEYPKQQNKSFRLVKTGGEYEVQPFYDFSPKIDKEIKTGTVEAFLNGFKKVGAEAFENQNPRRDSVARQVPFSRITLTTTDGEELKAAFYPILPEAQTVDVKTGSALQTSSQVERFFVDINDGEDFMLAQQRVFGHLFWAYESFYE